MKIAFSFFLLIYSRVARRLLGPHDTLPCVLIYNSLIMLGSSGLDKRQCIVQLTLFANGVPLVKPLVMFRCTGKRITFIKLRYDRQAVVCFQENVWCDEPTMIYWVRQHWKSHVEGPALLCLDQHKAQKTPSI